jgi:predicted permease
MQEETVFTIKGRPPVRPEDLPLASYTIVSPDFFNTAHVPLRGRAFTDADDANSPPVVIISQAMAREFWPGEDPVGHLMSLPDPRWQNMTIVGVVGDVKKFALSDSPGPEMYVPYKQKPYPSMLTMPFVLRTTRDSLGLTNELQQAVKSVDSELPVANVQPMAELVSRSMSPQKLSASVLGAFSVVALILAIVGIYGVISYMVNERNHEIGVRIALGAQKYDVLRLVFSQATRLVAAGLGLGFVAALSLTRMLTSFVFGIKAADPITFTVAPLALLMAASLAIYIPARRASAIDPMDTLRNE